MLEEEMLVSSCPVDFLTVVLEHLDTRALQLAESYNSTTNYPAEHAFQGEIFLFLSSAFKALQKAGKTHWTALMEAKNLMTGAKRADLLLFDGRRILVELKAAQEFDKGMFLCFASLST